MFGLVGHRDGLVDQQNRHTVVDAIHTPQPRVVQALVVDQKERTTVLGTDEDAEELFVEHGRASALRRKRAALRGGHARRRAALRGRHARHAAAGLTLLLL